MVVHTVSDSIYVTKTFLPDFENYMERLRGVFERGQLTNQGVLVRQLEFELENYLSVDSLQYVSNGTVALQLALRALDLQGAEIITTPFSYVATTSSLLWEGCSPVFVDIEPDFFTIDSNLIEDAITPNTKAILAVHVFGNSCNVEKIDAIAKKHDLKVIYDGAHAFGTTYKGKSGLSYGDVSTLSFHATKLFHTVEGGGCVSSDSAVNEKIDLIKRFGHVQDDHLMLGINAKQSEFHAAMGLSNLQHIEEILSSRKQACERYEEIMKDVLPLRLNPPGCSWNYSYFPVVFDTQQQLKWVFAELEKEKIYPRRYFYPSLNILPYVKDAFCCPVSEDISQRIACLPLYHGLPLDSVTRIADLIKKRVREFRRKVGIKNASVASSKLVYT